MSILRFHWYFLVPQVFPLHMFPTTPNSFPYSCPRIQWRHGAWLWPTRRFSMGLWTGWRWARRMYQKNPLTSRVSWFNESVGGTTLGTNQAGTKRPAHRIICPSPTVMTCRCTLCWQSSCCCHLDVQQGPMNGHWPESSSVEVSHHTLLEET